jgi:hypothetical protein
MKRTISGVFKDLAIVTLEGFDPSDHDLSLDPLGSANWFCVEYGMTSPIFDPNNQGILWTDYCGSGWKFAVLIDARELDTLIKFAKECDYDVIDHRPVSKPEQFGDGNGTVEILKHRAGWVVLS